MQNDQVTSADFLNFKICWESLIDFISILNEYITFCCNVATSSFSNMAVVWRWKLSIGADVGFSTQVFTVKALLAEDVLVLK